MLVDKRKLQCWKDIKVGELITLKDEQTLEFLMGEGVDNIANGADFFVKRKRAIQIRSGAKWLIFDIALGEEFLWYLVVSSMDNAFDVSVCFMPQFVPEGDRWDFKEQNCLWLFDVDKAEAEAKAEETIDMLSLDFVSNFEDKDGISFSTSGPIYGTLIESGEKDSFATIVEYEAKGVENPFVYVVEQNNINDEGAIEDSSYIFMIQGCHISLSDLEILK
ncbi:MAG: hypothetical protein J7L15_09405 [Clostridiales bacterium]|nr:hypothetical protein [Clostridiales bacterium]